MPFGVVEPVDAQHQPLFVLIAGGCVARECLEAGVVDAEREGADPHRAGAVLDALLGAGDALAEQPLHAVQEVGHVARAMEPDQVTLEHPAQ
jgi:hypothetical protein